MTQKNKAEREIKFRIIWKGKTYYWGYIPGGFAGLPTTSDGLSMERAKELSCQYTGLKDKNGKEIYEGDIVKHKTIGCYTGQEFNDDSIGIVKIVKTGFKYQKSENIEKYDFDFGDDLVCEEHYEVIGNIYENPELLKA